MGAKDVGVVLGIVAVLLLLIAACYAVIAPRLDPACGHCQDRDLNAAVNLMNVGIGRATAELTPGE